MKWNNENYEGDNVHATGTRVRPTQSERLATHMLILDNNLLILDWCNVTDLCPLYLLSQISSIISEIRYIRGFYNEVSL